MNSVGIERHLFLAGCPRSGTSALVFLLNEHPQLVLGFERFKRVRAQLDPFHFTPAQFFAPVTAETDIRGELLYARLRERWEGGKVSVIGDKVPLYTRVLPQLLARFPAGRVVVLVRDPLDVAASFLRRARDPQDWWPAENDHTLAVRMWNEALAAVRDAERRGAGERVFLLPYEPLFAGETRWLDALLAFAGLSPSARLLAEHRRMTDRRSASGGGSQLESEVMAYVQAHIDLPLRDWARERMARQLAAAPTVSPLGPGEDEVPLTGEDQAPLTAPEVDARERERGQLLDEMRRPGERAPDELEILERRLLDQAAELARRGVAPVRSKPRVTFILPHQRVTTGGVYVIEEFARHLAEQMTVCLAVRELPSREVPGVELRWAERLDGETLPAADLLVYPADLRDAARLEELPASRGRPVLFFQGYGTPDSPVVHANLTQAQSAVAIAHWLVEESLRHQIPCAYVPQGLDRAVFAPGGPARERPARVTLMTHALSWKGTQDALDALALVRAERPDVELVLFGTEAVAGVGSYHERPSRQQVAELLRSSAVHVVASWEEGFGLTGAEAIACGAALATTDTRGSRDYAVDGLTALVSPPRDPRALARNVLALLEDSELRTRLVVAGQRHLDMVMPPWPEAARRMALALECARAH